jgi:hypothetical protein
LAKTTVNTERDAIICTGNQKIKATESKCGGTLWKIIASSYLKADPNLGYFLFRTDIVLNVCLDI